MGDPTTTPALVDDPDGLMPSTGVPAQRCWVGVVASVLLLLGVLAALLELALALPPTPPTPPESAVHTPRGDAV